ncbi:MAG: hypothetical protein J6I83_02170, partial [Firmicutes bacterium]|nr:hypothetical protein [Bacillota bacterium]
ENEKNNGRVTVTDDFIVVGFDSFYYSDLNTIYIERKGSDYQDGLFSFSTKGGKMIMIHFDKDDNVRIEESVNKIRKKMGLEPVSNSNINSGSNRTSSYSNRGATYNPPKYNSSDKKSSSSNSKGDDVLGAGCIVVVLIIMIIAVVFFFKGCAYILSDHDADNDGLTDSFEQEQGTDPNNYTWNWEWND